MMGRFEPGPGRERLGFEAAVVENFAFLKEAGFECVRRECTFVRYESKRVFVNVYHGRGSFELGVEGNRRYWHEFNLRVQREKAEKAWMAKDFRAVVESFESMREDLTPLEEKKLAYARKHGRRGGMGERIRENLWFRWRRRE